MVLTLVFAEAALELVPREIAKHPSVMSQARRKGKKPDDILLDVSYHHAAMKPYDKYEKRGRPDIAHFSLLEALGSPLNQEGRLETWVHTVQDEAIRIDPETRLPRNYDRFVSLMEQLLRGKQVPPDGPALLQAETLPLGKLIQKIQPTKLVGLSTLGERVTLEEICNKLAGGRRPAIMVGAFARGHFAVQNASRCDQVFCIDKAPLESWIVTSRAIYEYECALAGFHEGRLIDRTDNGLNNGRRP
jgi:rRNA small subunit pseudouridine methyltransferase Nep1